MAKSKLVEYIESQPSNDGYGESLDDVRKSNPKLQALSFEGFVSLNDIVESSKSGLPIASLHPEEKVQEKVETPDSRLVKPLKQFVKIDKFHTEKTTSGRALLVSITHLPANLLSSAPIIEELLEHIVGLTLRVNVTANKKKAVISSAFRWSYIEDDFLDSKAVFVEFDDVLTLYLFQMLLDGVDRVEVSTKNTLQPILDECRKKFKVGAVETLREDVSKQMEELSKLFKATKEDKQDLHYKVNPADLEDVPEDIVDIVTQSIIKFRSQAAVTEREKRAQRRLEEKKRSRTKIRQLFKEIKKDDAMDETPSKSDDEDELFDLATDDLASEKQRETIRSKRIDAEYQERLKQLKVKEQIRLKEYDRFTNFDRHEVYVSKTVPEARAKFLSSFVEGVTDSSNKIDRSFDYYTKHNNYLKFRNGPREAEERRDDADRKINKQVVSLAEFEKKPAVKISLKKRKHTDQAEGIKIKMSKKAGYSNADLAKIKKEAAVLVEEYLGEAEDSLIEFMLEFAKKRQSKGTSAYEAFVKELSETLEDDATAAADRLCDFMESL